ncbi:excinuclease [Burkholderia phage vB_BceS_AH2]|uniref:Excinuclease n=1 Tax=Burkholderia phage vB_BceS_AH2 TaxID=1133022 RepID=I6NP88_9CAUD|nr:excinuclease [Burkholderia phage vB_BceS_AH2]AEY69543.1 excinuclease [Burkholderia phage vB_BceS_AH2]
MAIDLSFRRKAVRTLTNEVGVYILCDLDQTPIYVGQSSDGIRARVNRHLTSARSDIIANRQIDVWEIAWVWAFPCKNPAERSELEARLFHYWHPKSALMNGSIPAQPKTKKPIPKPTQIVQVMSDAEIDEKKDPALRLPRQAERYSEIVNHFISVKNSKQIARAMEGHFARLLKYHKMLIGSAESDNETEE